MTRGSRQGAGAWHAGELTLSSTADAILNGTAGSKVKSVTGTTSGPCQQILLIYFTEPDRNAGRSHQKL